MSITTDSIPSVGSVSVPDIVLIKGRHTVSGRPHSCVSYFWLFLSNWLHPFVVRLHSGASFCPQVWQKNTQELSFSNRCFEQRHTIGWFWVITVSEHGAMGWYSPPGEG
jgi:hypothetical protein